MNLQIGAKIIHTQKRDRADGLVEFQKVLGVVVANNGFVADWEVVKVLEARNVLMATVGGGIMLSCAAFLKKIGEIQEA